MILIAEDNPVVRKLTVSQLRKLGYKTVEVPCGGEAINQILSQGEHIDLVFMDVQMPRVDGIQATKRIREIEQEGGKRRVPIIALTACTDARTCLSAGMDDFCQKPMLLERLQQVLAQWLPHFAESPT